MISIFDFLNVYSVFCCVAVLLWFYSKSAYSFWRKLNVKYLEPIPFFGNTAKILFRITTFHDGYHSFYTTLDKEPYGGIYELNQPQLIVKNPELVSNILVRDFRHFQDRGMRLVVNKNKELNPMSFHLFFTEGERWKVLRQKMSPVFTSGKLKHMHDQVVDCIASLTKSIDQQLDGNDSVDMALKELFEKLTIDVIGSCAFGIECNSTTNEKFSEMGREVFRPKVSQAIRMVVGSISPRLVNILSIPDMKKDVTDFFKDLVFDTIDYRRRNSATRADVLQLLMELQNSYVNPKFAVSSDQKKILTNEKFDEIDIAANSFLFFNAGFETTASTLSYCFYELALNQDIQERLRSEVQEVKNKNPHQMLDYDSLRNLTYMDAVIHETLRKYPPVVVLNRECTEEYEMPGTKTRIPVGTQVIIPVWSIQHDWKNYPNPEVFDPERFLGDNKHSRNSGTFLTFGEGPRYCIDIQQMYKQSLKSLVTHFLANAIPLRMVFRKHPEIDVFSQFLIHAFLQKADKGVNLEWQKELQKKEVLRKRFADMEVKSALAEMILKYNFKPCAKTKIPLQFKGGSIILQTTCGTWANLEKRK